MYSVARMKSGRKPPLPKSPIRFRPRPGLRSTSASLQTPSGSLAKSERPNRCWDNQENLRPEYRSISCELQALAKMVRNQFGNGDSDSDGIANSFAADSSPLFERGLFYEEYTARRNERLRSKKKETGHERKTAYGLGVTGGESAKRSSSTKKLENLRKSVSAAYSVEQSEAPSTSRYMLRSMTKENKKPPLPVNSRKSSVLAAEPKMGTRSVRRG